MNKKLVIIIGMVLIAISLLSGCIDSVEKKGYVDSDEPVWQNRFLKMRDLFTPMYNDSVTIENAGYDNGWLFWVNHSKVLSSFYYPNMQNYLIRFTMDDDIELLSNPFDFIISVRLNTTHGYQNPTFR